MSEMRRAINMSVWLSIVYNAMKVLNDTKRRKTKKKLINGFSLKDILLNLF